MDDIKLYTIIARKVIEVEIDIDFIDKELGKFNERQRNVKEVMSIIEVCTPSLIKIKNKLGENDDIYIQGCNVLAEVSLNMLISYINFITKKRNNHIDYLNSKNGMCYNSDYINEQMEIIRKNKEKEFQYYFKNIDDKIKPHVEVNYSEIPSPPKINLIEILDEYKLGYKAFNRIGDLIKNQELYDKYNQNRKDFIELYKKLDESVTFIDGIRVKKWIFYVIGAVFIDIVLNLIYEEKAYGVFFLLFGLFAIPIAIRKHFEIRKEK